ncbi:hypothetical protein CI109_106150 [Kwoniella shandongensis]|uniref:Uncharacterized protein n=1 Tax=Kwoniella shandongensis TaxID=1734106 RepID=A0A5M6BY64_9TREE|nr:uncharacterized protein CI109_003758 [Kwoniella shandongensis]KAA5527787.1 hypothetical protein CI109_003758 [Kwoniella shandongensis]
MGLSQSRATDTSETNAPSTPSVPPPPRPSASRLNPNPPSVLSYFLPIPTPVLTHDHLHPTYLEIRLVTRYLTHLGLPPELAPRILDEAGYWAGCRRQSGKQLAVRAMDPRGHVRNGVIWSTGQEDEVGMEARGPDGGLKGGPGEIWYLVSSPIGCWHQPGMTMGSTLPIDPDGDRQRVWVREVVFETLSKDQGWSNFQSHYGTYEQSYSWFEVALLRDGREVEGSRHSVQNNVHAGQYFKAHSNTLDRSHPTVKLARPGDRFVLWARAKYPGWSNNVMEAAITVFTSPFPPQI